MSNDPAAEKGEKIQQVFTDLNRKFEERETQRRASKWSAPYFDLTGLPVDESTLALVPKAEAEAALAIPFSKEGSVVKLGVVEPQNPDLRKLLSRLQKNKFQLEIFLVSQGSFRSALKQYKKILPVSSTQKHEVMVETGPEVLAKLKALPEIGEKLLALPATELLNLVIGGAITMQSSDIHLEPEKSLIKIRYRVDGVLQDAVALPLSLLHLLMSRIKLLAGLKLNVTNSPQDGRFSVKLKEKILDLRVSVLPSAHGESVVMRILGIQDIGLEIEKLGLHGLALRLLYQEIDKPNGLILTTGPTGSGKTTTLYAFLNYLNKPGLKTITIEDPVEYMLPGIIQTPIDRSAGLDFAKALRSILRQDPDIVMVGEIRDFETAETACQAALTGHLVFSTLHTNDAAGAIPRLLDLGVKPVTLAPALSALIAQRLLRKICQDCREVYHPATKEFGRVEQALKQILPKSEVQVPEKLTFYHSPGCHKCHDLGYQGRIGVFEVLAVDETIERLVYNQASTTEIKKSALAQGMVTMLQDGILKALEGLTDLSEVWRVTEE